MGDIMTFPKRWEDFLHDYEFEDARRIYTNGSRLIPSFRIKQMMEHYAPVVHGRWIEYQIPHIICCSNCDWATDATEKNFQYCPMCGARMDRVE